MTVENGTISTVLTSLRQVATRWWNRSGIGFRVSFLMIAALTLVSVLIGAYFLWEGKEKLTAEVRSRTSFLAHELAAITTDDIGEGNRIGIYKKIKPYFHVHEDVLSGSSLLYVIIYDQKCNLLVGSTASEMISIGMTFPVTVPSEVGNVQDILSLQCNPSQGRKAILLTDRNGVSIYDCIIPILLQSERIGFMRVGVSRQRYGEKFADITKKAGIALIGIFLVALAFSRIIALGIVKPISRLSEAVDKLRQQKWDAPLPVKGSDEISKLGHAFNQMAVTLKEREASLSRGNAELFVLHSVGLEFMEHLDRDALLVKIAARAEELVRSETTGISLINSANGMLNYLEVFGSKANVLKQREMPIEAGGIYNWLVSYDAPLLIPDAQNDFRLDSELMRLLGITSVITVPLWLSNTLTGLLTTINKKGGGRFDEHDLHLVTVFSSLASAALQNASLYGDLKEKVSELKAAQEQLIHSTKMAAIGELSTSVAHEINNPLTSVLGYTTHLLKTIKLPEAQKNMLGIVEQEILRVRKFIRNLLDFARHDPSWMQPADITAPLREALTLLQGIAEKSSITIEEEYPPKPVIVTMDHNEMKQVFLNIVSNAVQAMPQGGMLTVKLENIDGHEIIVKFSDTGIGIPPENMSRIFQPFFTTKSNGDGTGLGLSISHRIVRNHGGRIEAESEEGKGTIFKVILPRTGKYPGNKSSGYIRAN